MSYNDDCNTYWCDMCGMDMEIDYHRSSNRFLFLKCTKCDSSRYFRAEPEPSKISDEETTNEQG